MFHQHLVVLCIWLHWSRSRSHCLNGLIIIPGWISCSGWNINWFWIVLPAASSSQGHYHVLDYCNGVHRHYGPVPADPVRTGVRQSGARAVGYPPSLDLDTCQLML